MQRDPLVPVRIKSGRKNAGKAHTGHRVAEEELGDVVCK